MQADQGSQVNVPATFYPEHENVEFFKAVLSTGCWQLTKLQTHCI